jgi:hypothetical protein
MWSSVLSQTCPCGHLYKVKPAHVVICIKSNLSMWSPLLSQTCQCGRGDHMDRFDLIEVTTGTGLA